MRVQKYRYFSEKMNNIAYKKRIPLHAMFELTYRCNFRCIHCYNTREEKLSYKKELRTHEVFNILGQLQEMGCIYLGFTGGEIFCREDMAEILWKAKKLGFQIIVLTNGSFIDEKIANELGRIRPNKIDITVNAMNEDRFEKITGTPGSYTKVFNAIRLLYEKKIPICVKTCGMQENKNEIIAINKFARTLNAAFRFDGKLTPRHDRLKTPLQHLISPKETYYLHRQCYPEMFEKYDHSGKERKGAKLDRRNIKRLFNCAVGYYDLAVNPYGELKFCINIDYPRYKILEGSLEKGWENLKNIVDSLKPPDDWACKECDLVNYCAWCPGTGYLEDGSFSTCDPLSREEAKFIRTIERNRNAKK
ncbi:MAG: hypothetical protein A2987_04085 [Omnitrophica bacterium RIFCSPLOWO2_01_FULL_45_10]|nr:MAG: hypothetical protein A2987_04085 [Omnitrophica bacterium RIFCSPLOWO2_01_FULL_45_10]